MRTPKAITQLPANANCGQATFPLVGRLAMITSSEGLHAILWECDLINPSYQALLPVLPPSSSCPVFQKTTQQLNEYFDGSRQTFDLPLVLHGTEFQLAAWKQLQNIEYGKTASYADQAQKIGRPKAFRAVGTANSANPISIVVPCHRVIAKSGALAGFGGGLASKRAFLDFEQECCVL